MNIQFIKEDESYKELIDQRGDSVQTQLELADLKKQVKILQDELDRTRNINEEMHNEITKEVQESYNKIVTD